MWIFQDTPETRDQLFIIGFSICIAEESPIFTAQKMKFSIKDFFSKYDQIRSFLRGWSDLLKKSLMENFIFLCSVYWENKIIYGLRPRKITSFQES